MKSQSQRLQEFVLTASLSRRVHWKRVQGDLRTANFTFTVSTVLTNVNEPDFEQQYHKRKTKTGFLTLSCSQNGGNDKEVDAKQLVEGKN